MNSITLDELNQQYALCDGKIRSIFLRPRSGEVDVLLGLRMRGDSKAPLGTAPVLLTFSGRVNYAFVDGNMDETAGDYSDITLVQLDDGRYYLSLDPFGNSGRPHDDDNDVVVADRLAVFPQVLGKDGLINQ
jgi:prepilin-type processing-associated H-X9-DG protein